MKPLAFVLFALCARFLWASPLWVTVVASVGVLGWLVSDEVLSRRRMKRYSAECEERNQAHVDNWEPCEARKEVLPGLFLHCVKRAGHDGDDGDHLAGRDDIYWSGN